MRYAIAIERGPKNFSAYVPDLPGCIAAGKSLDDTRRPIAEAIEFHLEGIRLRGEPVLEPSSGCEYVEAS